MTGFTLEDAGPSFQLDIISRLDRIAELAAEPNLGGDAARLEEVSQCFHAIRGTASLVNVASLAEAAKTLEESIDAYREGSATALDPRVVHSCGETDRVLRQMLAFEVAGQPENAWALLEQFSVLGTPVPLDELPDDPLDIAHDEEFSFEDVQAPESPRPGGENDSEPELRLLPDDGALGDDLALVFQEEAREALPPLARLLGALERDPESRRDLEELEGLFHRLKGSAATVRLNAVAQRASGLRAAIERVLQGSHTTSSEWVRSLREQTLDFLVEAGLPPLDAPAGAPPAVGARDLNNLAALFAAEVDETCQEAANHLLAIASATTSDEEAASTRLALAGAFHRLKGSAFLASAAPIATAAARLQALCEGDEPLHTVTEEVKRGVAWLKDAGRTNVAAAMSMTDVPSAHGPEVGAEAPDPEVLEAFHSEAADILDDIDRSLVALDGSTPPQPILQNLFRGYHTLKGAANTVGLRAIGDALHSAEEWLEGLLAERILPPIDRIEGALHEVQAGLRHAVSRFVQGVSPSDSLNRVHAALTAVRASHPAEASAEETVSIPKRSSFELEKTAGPDSSGNEWQEERRRGIRVPAARLDSLMNLAGELVVNRSRQRRRIAALRLLQRDLAAAKNRLIAVVDRFKDKYEFALDRPAHRAPSGSSADASVFSEIELDRYQDINILSRTLSEVGATVAELQDRISGSLDGLAEDGLNLGVVVSAIQEDLTRARMVPLDRLFMRLRLPVREAADRLKRSVRIEVFGENVALDKTIVDDLYLPLLHLVRNSVAHGIESPAERARRGKSESGLITLRARQEAGLVLIEVSDDGSGLDLARLHTLGVQADAFPVDTPLDAPAVADAIFLPGLTTRDSADEVSGRGFGCDVARREIERMAGRIQVRTSRQAGTTFTITLPVTLSVTRALMVRLGESVFALPLHFSERILDFEDAEVVQAAGAPQICVADQYIPLRSLSELLGLGTEAQRRGRVVVLQAQDRRLALVVDEVLGQEEIVVKGLAQVLGAHELFSGVTVSGEGDLILILDIPSVLGMRSGPSAPEGAAPEPRSLRRRVLFADDSLSVRKVAGRFLAALGVKVDLAVDGFDALTRLRAASYDAVFTDLEMPRLHGFELIREMQASERLRSIPIVVVSSRSGQKHREQALALGAAGYLTKPFTESDLAAALDRHLQGDSIQ